MPSTPVPSSKRHLAGDEWVRSSRRDLIIRGARLLALVAVVPFVGGCPDDPNAAPAAKPAPVSLTFREEDAFYAQLDAAVRSGAEVTVSFDGTQKVSSPDSRFVKVLREAQNAGEIVAAIRANDTEDGRRALATAFAPDLLKHEVVRNHSKVGNEVVEPGTIIICVAILLLAAGAATATVIQSTRYRLDLDMEIGARAVRFRMRSVA